MEEFWQACISPLNLPYSTLLFIVGIYWLKVILGVVSLPGQPALDLLKGGHGMEEVSLAKTALFEGTEAKSLDHIDWLSPFIFWILGNSPITVFVSFFLLSSWTFSLLFNHFMENTSLLIGMAFFLPNSILSLFVARVSSAPFGKLFQALSHKHPDHHQNLVGKICTVITSRVDADFGQAEIKTRGAPHIIDIRSLEKIHLKEGDQGLIFSHDPVNNCYLVHPYDCEKIEVD